MGKFLSWVLLFVTAFFAIQALTWSSSEWADNSTYLFIYCLAVFVCGFWTTILSPRTPAYDLVRYFLMAALAWMAYHESIAIMVGIIVLAVLFLPFVILDFQGKRKAGRDRLMVYVAEAMVRDARKTNRRIDTMSENFDKRQRKKAAKKAAKEHEKEYSRRMFEWTAGWFWD